MAKPRKRDVPGRLEVATDPRPFDHADATVRDLADDRVHGAAVLVHP